MRTTQGPKRVDVIYRRVDDDFLDPLAFRPDSALGVAGLMAAYQAGNVTLANAVGTGIADDKAVYSYMPEIVRFYLGEEPILKNVPTWRCREPEHLAYVLDHLEELVVKEVDGSGGYGMLVGPTADKARSRRSATKLKPSPRLHRAADAGAVDLPTCVEAGVAPRHVDLRPFVLTGRDRIRIVPGGLTRVALKQARWWSTPARAAAPRTPGCWIGDECCRAPPTTCSGSRAMSSAPNISRASSSDAAPDPMPLAYGGETNEWDGGRHRRLRRRLLRRSTTRPTRKLSRLPGVLARQSVLDPQLLRVARPNARAVRTALTTEMWDAINSAWLELSASATAGLARGVRAVPALGAGILAALRRLGLPHHAAQRRLLVLAARRLHGARRQHRAHPRREVSSAAAGPRACRRPARLFPVGGDPALGVGADRLSLGLSREVKPWLIADLLILNEQMPRSLASCYENLVQNLDRIAGNYGRQGPAQRQARKVRAPITEHPHGRHLPDRPARIHRRLHRRQQPSRQRDNAAVLGLIGLN